MTSDGSHTRPLAPGYCTNAPNTSTSAGGGDMSYGV